jgi:V8-like Glu-specific endopeptidase
MKSITIKDAGLILIIGLIACKGDTKSEARKEVGYPEAQVDSIKKKAQTFFDLFQNKNFLRQLKQGENYTVEIIPKIESHCLEPNFKKIYEYNGELGPSRNFVTRHSPMVGAISATNQQDDSGKFCSGTLISKNLFLTASHCVDMNTIGQYVAFNYQLSASGKLGPQFFYKITKIAEIGYKDSLDYAILELEGNPGKKFGYARIANMFPKVKDSITIIQHPSGRPKEIEAGLVSSLTDKSLLYDDIDTEPGSSGSGIINREGKLAGVHTNGGCSPYSMGGANHGVNIKTIAGVSKVLKKIIN